jgi:eukaryotic-like serine/threonine-protein kinase
MIYYCITYHAIVYLTVTFIRRVSMTDRQDQQLGNYRLLSSIGRGGFAEVYLAEHIFLKTPAAIKLLQTKLVSQDDLNSFLREAQTIARLVHPHIIRVFDFGVDEQTPYLVMDYAMNGTLRQRHPKGDQLELSSIASYVNQIADALQYAHDEKLIHRDVKPENMLLGRRNEILMSDFGIALIAQSSRYQSTQEVIGTVAYMSPEQIQGKPRPASDQYSLGVVVYEWLCGDRPFHGSFTELCTQHIFAEPPPLREKFKQVPPDVEEILRIALAKDPKQRFSNIKEFARAFEQASQGSSTTQIRPSDLQATVLPPTMPVMRGSPLANTLPHSSSLSKATIDPERKDSTNRKKRYSFSIGQIALFGALILLIVLGSVGGFVFAKNNSQGKSPTSLTTSTPGNSPVTEKSTVTSGTTPTNNTTPVITPVDTYGRITSGPPAFSDSLSKQDANQWDEDTECGFNNGTYHASVAGTNFYGYCIASRNTFANFIYQVQMTIVSGDYGGIVFRVNVPKFYYARIGQDGTYGIYRVKGRDGTFGQELGGGFSSAIKQGPGQTNQIAIVAQGSKLDLYINQNFVASVIDGSYSDGQVGVIAVPGNSPTDVAFSNAQVWTL